MMLRSAIKFRVLVPDANIALEIKMSPLLPATSVDGTLLVVPLDVEIVTVVPFVKAAPKADAETLLV